MEQSRPRRRPEHLDFSQRTKALRTSRDPFFPTPSKTPTSAKFFQHYLTGPLPHQTEISDYEDRRNTCELNMGTVFNGGVVVYPEGCDVVVQTDSPVDDLTSSSYALFGAYELPACIEPLLGLPPVPERVTLIREIHKKAADANNGTYPKVGLFSQELGVKETGAFETYNEDVSTDSDSSDATDSPTFSGQEDEAPLFDPPVQSTPAEEEEVEEEKEEIASSPIQYEIEETRSFAPVYDHSADEDADAEGDNDDDDDYNEMDHDDSSDDEFVDKTFNTQQRRAFAKYEKMSTSPSAEASTPKTKTKNTRTRGHVSRKTISLPIPTEDISSSSRSSSPVSTPPSSAPPSASSSPSSRKRKSPTPSEDNQANNFEEVQEIDHDMYTIVRDKNNKPCFQCKICPEVCTKAFGDMKRHLESLKHKKPSHKCDPDKFGFGCGRVFTRRDALKRHMISQHPINWTIYEAENLEVSRKRVKKA